MGEWVDVCAEDELAPASSRTVWVDDTTVLVCNVKGEFFAVENVCSHDGDALDQGDLDGDRIICPRHGARFCLRSGRALTPPAYEPIAVFEVQVRAGRIEVRDPRRD